MLYNARLSPALPCTVNVAGLVTLIVVCSSKVRSPRKSLFPTPSPRLMDASLRELCLSMEPLEPHLSRYLDRHSSTLRYLSVSVDSPGLAEKLTQLPK